MVIMICKMSAVTILNVLLTLLIRIRTKDREMTLPLKAAVGVVYGVSAILATHFSVNYSQMLLNVRDMGPLAAGLFFDPVSGIIAGLIGGFERYLAGTFWGIGSFTRVACSVSTCLAGFVSALMNRFLFRGKNPSGVYAFFMGAVMEVFHMYAVFITHSNDMDMAFYVVRICAMPMILFTGFGLALSAVVLQIQAVGWRNPLARRKGEEVTVSQKFQFWLFTVVIAVFFINIQFSYFMQSQSAVQSAHETLTQAAGDIRDKYQRLQGMEENIDNLTDEATRQAALLIAGAVERTGGVETADAEFLEKARSIYGVESVAAVRADGTIAAAAGETQKEAPVYSNLLRELLGKKAEVLSADAVWNRSVAGAACGGGMIQVVASRMAFRKALDFNGLNAALTHSHVGKDGTLDLVRLHGTIIGGTHQGTALSGDEMQQIGKNVSGKSFQMDIFGERSLCLAEPLSDDVILFIRLPVSEIYSGRDAYGYENVLSDILVFSVTFVLISLLVQSIVVSNLDLVNASLRKITRGDLDEVVDVRNSSEFASLSDDINRTVDALKGYIEAAEKRMEQDMEMARAIQRSALPGNFTFTRNDFELYATMDPAKFVGGDFYDFFFVGQNRLALVIADVSGKGIPAALFMMRAKTTIRGLAEGGKSPSEILSRANNTLCDGNDAEMFVTVWLGIIDLETGEMCCSNAGHEYPALMREGGDYEMYRDRHGLVLAAMEGVHYREYVIRLQPGDRLFVYTDGVPEAINGETEQYGEERLLRALNGLRREDMKTTLAAVRRDISDFVDGADQFDDITMLGIIYRGGGSGGE